MRAEFFPTPDLTGNAAARRTDGPVWYGFPAKCAWPDGIAGGQAFSARWTGRVEPRFSEEYTFSVYATGGVRLWVDGELLIDEWAATKRTRRFAAPKPLRRAARPPCGSSTPARRRGRTRPNCT